MICKKCGHVHDLHHTVFTGKCKCGSEDWWWWI